MGTGETVLDVAEHSMEAIADAMVSMMSFISDGQHSKLALYGCSSNVESLEQSLNPLQRQLNQGARFVRMNWNRIVENDMLIDVAAEFMRHTEKFYTVVAKFDECVVNNESVAFELLQGSWIARKYLAIMYEWKVKNRQLANAVLCMSDENEQEQDPFYGIARKFRPYFVGVTDEQIKELVLNKRPLGSRPIWLGDRCEGTLMGRELGLECSDMNHSFRFRNKQGRPRDLKYSSDALNNDRRYYKISEVLDCVKEAKEMIIKEGY